MNPFNEDQIKYLEKVYGLKPVGETLPVRDGIVTKEDKVWWRCSSGPQLITAENDWRNIKEFPEIYSLNEPKVEVKYLD